MSTVELPGMPAPGPLYRRAALTLVPGIGAARRGTTLPDVELAVRAVPVDRDRLADYDQVCGFRLSDVLPATFPHVMGFPLALRLMTAPDFPIALAGIVHIANRIVMRRPIFAGEVLDFAVRAADLRPHARGRQLDIVLTASVEGVEVWRGVSTYLSRERTTAPAARAERAASAAPTPAGPAAPAAPAGSVASNWWRVEPRVGTDYARVSGDHNPIHTSRLGARLFGFRHPIAHGMWSKARCLAALDGRLPEAYTVDVAFKAALPLPSTVAFTAVPGWTFALHSAAGKPHLTGTVG
ncbi:MAG TPA: MaoC/PaaZ C-terminal domain-containing protein [Micromonosporaceae bacterium]